MVESTPSLSQTASQAVSQMNSLTVCYFGTYRSTYSRNRIMIEGLRLNNVKVIECHEKLWHGIDDRVDAVRGGWLKPTFWWRLLRSYMRLLMKFIHLPDEYDLVIVGYPGQFDLFLARLLTWWKDKPLVWDIFMSIYLISLERHLDRRSPISVRFLYLVEKIACRLPDQLIIDTAMYANWFAENYQINTNCFKLVPTGADDSIFFPRSTTENIDALHRLKHEDDFVVLYYGTYIPNHGVLRMVESARLVQKQQQIQFLFVGDGPEKAAALQLAQAYELKNVRFVEWVTQAQLVNLIGETDLCLGSFGSTPQSIMTIQNKIYECMAMARPVLTGDSSAVREALCHKKHIYLCQRDNPQAIADAITELAYSPALCLQLATAGYERFLEEFTVRKIGERYRMHLLRMLGAALVDNV